MVQVEVKNIFSWTAGST